MTSKERVLRSLAWQTPDRPPVECYFTPEIEAVLKAHFTGKNIYEELCRDFRDVRPGAIKKPGAKPGEKPTTRKIVTDSGATYVEHVYFPLAELKTMEDVNRHVWPSADGCDYATIPEQCERNRDYAIVVGGENMPDILNGVSRERGMEQVMMDIALRDEVGLAIIDKRINFQLEYLERILEAAGGLADIVQLGEDTGNQNGRMFSPRDFEEVFRPRLQRYIDLAHAYGAKAKLHSCGDTHELMPTFMMMGLDILDAMQPEPPGMNPVEGIRALCAGKLAFCGLISTQKTLPFGTEAECRAEARHRLDVIARGGGYIFAPAHAIQADTPLRNVLAIYEEALGRHLM